MPVTPALLLFVVLQAPEAEACADIEFVLVVAGGHDLNDERIFEVMAVMAGIYLLVLLCICVCVCFPAIRLEF